MQHSALPFNLQLHPPRAPSRGEKLWRYLAFCLAGCVLFTGVCPAAPEKDSALVVGVREVAPFVVRNPDGSLDGMSIMLWRSVAADLALQYEFRDTTLTGMLEGLRDGPLDVAAAALTVTPEREKAFDFSHPFYTSGLGIAVPHSAAGWWQAISAVFSWQFVQALGALVVVLLSVGLIVWLLERRTNTQQFGGKVHEGIGSGLWWSAVTMTTVGYGDKAPVTPAGRMVAIVWMFVSIITISGFTAAIASVFTAQQLGSRIKGPNDLHGLTVATVPGSTSADYLAKQRIRVRQFEGPRDAMEAVAKGEVDAAVYDAPIMRYLSNGEFAGQVDVLPVTFSRQDYALGLRAGSPLREELNRALLRYIRSPAWEETLYRFLGD
jgi:polar amino acid transport system substrate-binding protein